MKKTTRFKKMLRSPQVEFLMEAHNGLSARIVEEAGFQGIWASGLSMSASLGVRDNNEAAAAGLVIRVLYIAGHWLDVDTLNDLSTAQTFASPL